MNARIFMLGEAPGQQEEDAGLPLVGPTGKITERFAHEAGFALAECFIVNVVREKPETHFINGKKVTNDITQYITDKKKQGIADGFILHNGLWCKPVVLEWLAQLERELALVRPELVVCLGRVALWALLERPAKITEWRGTFFTHRVPCEHGSDSGHDLKCLATFHPASVFRNPNAAAFIARDFGRVASILSNYEGARYGNDDREAVLEDGVQKNTAPVGGIGGAQQIAAGGQEFLGRQVQRARGNSAFHFTIRPSFDLARQLLAGLLQRLDASTDTLVRIAVDIETKSKQIDCIGFGLSATEAFCIPIMCRAGSYWSEEEEAEIVELLRRVLLHPNLEVLGQNFSYDAQYLARQWAVALPRHLYDTMVSWHVLFPGLEKGLDVLNSIFAEHPEQWKPENKEVSRRWSDEETWTYNCKDCVATFIVAEQIPALIAKEGLEGPWAFQHRQLPVLQRMMLRGVRWNAALAAELDTDLSRRIDAVQEQIDFIAGHSLNVGSNGATGQMQRFFYHDLQIDPILDRKSKQPTTGKEALPAIAKREPILRPLTQLIEHRRRMATYRSTFIRAKTDWDGRMRSSFNVAGTETFRYASSGDAFWLGTNLQNFPKGKDTALLESLTEAGSRNLQELSDAERDSIQELSEVGFVSIKEGIASANPNFRLPNVRKLIQPDPGMILASCDLDKADAQIVAAEANDLALLHIFKSGANLHKENAKALGWNPDDQQDYDMAKRFVHATNYRGKPRTLAMSLSTMTGRHVTIREVEIAQDRWFSEHPAIRRWHERVLTELREKHEIRNRFGFRRYYFDPPDSILPEALAWVPQSTVALITDHGICNLDEKFSAEGVEVLLQVHDEPVFQFPIANLPRLPLYLEALRIPVPYPDPLIIPVSCKLSTKSWGELVPMEKFDPAIH